MIKVGDRYNFNNKFYDYDIEIIEDYGRDDYKIKIIGKRDYYLGIGEFEDYGGCYIRNRFTKINDFQYVINKISEGLTGNNFTVPKCECGAHHTDFPQVHMRYCPLFKPIA